MVEGAWLTMKEKLRPNFRVVRLFCKVPGNQGHSHLHLSKPAELHSTKSKR